MPDKWEYPWYAAWDLAFHCIPLALVDAEFAKQQLVLLTREWYMHPNGQLPAYEWAFGDVNPPVHAWAAWRVFQIDRKQRGDQGDLAFLERVFHKLLLNFTWWVNRKDAQGRNIFQGGFLGLDNIGVFDRSAPLPTGGFINQADGTSWMAMYCLNLMRIALELARHNPVYEDIATKFFEHFLYIAEAMTNIGGEGIGLWDDEDEFYYDVLNLPDGTMIPLRLRSMVGLIPLFAVETLEPDHARAGCREFKRAPGVVPELPPGPRRAGVALARARRRRAPPALAAARPPHEVPAPARCSTRPSSCRDYGVRALSQVPRAAPLRLRLRRPAPLGEATSRPSRTAACSAATRTGAGRSGSRSTTCSSSRCRSSTTTTATTSRSSARPAPGSFITLDEVADELTAAADPALPARRGRPAAGVRRPRRSCRPIRTSATTSCSTSTSTATTAAASARRTRPAGPALVAKLLQPRRREGDQTQPKDS